jgi:hypothetical protein
MRERIVGISEQLVSLGATTPSSLSPLLSRGRSNDWPSRASPSSETPSASTAKSNARTGDSPRPLVVPEDSGEVEEAFVPEEEEGGPLTQGDHLMAAKTRRSRGSGGESSTSASFLARAAPSTPGREEELNADVSPWHVQLSSSTDHVHCYSWRQASRGVTSSADAHVPLPSPSALPAPQQVGRRVLGPPRGTPVQIRL